MESQPQNPEFRNNPENFHPMGVYGQRYKKFKDFSSIIKKVFYIYWANKSILSHHVVSTMH